MSRVPIRAPILAALMSAVAAQQPEVLHFLPYEHGSTFQCWQGVDQRPSHHDKWNRYAIDFSPMKVGTPVYATASGAVVWVKEDTTGPT